MDGAKPVTPKTPKKGTKKAAARKRNTKKNVKRCVIGDADDGFPGWDGMGSSAGNGAGISAE